MEYQVKANNQKSFSTLNGSALVYVCMCMCTHVRKGRETGRLASTSKKKMVLWGTPSKSSLL